jgi:hypothetical protein
MDLPCYNCVLCASQEEETLVHLFLDCPFAQACWDLLGLEVLQGDPVDALVPF